MNWIRVAVGIGDDPKVAILAERLNCRVAEAVGLVVSLLTKFPEHAPDGNLAHVPARLVERWAGWEGERGAFDAAFRKGCLDESGIWPAWDKHNGKALQKLTRDRERVRIQREAREGVAHLSRDSRASVAGTDVTDVRSTTTGRSRAFSHNGQRPHKPDPFCPHCGEGMGKRHPSDLKLVLLHKPDCPRPTP